MRNIHLAGNFLDYMSSLSAKETKQVAKAVKQIKVDPTIPALRRHAINATPSKSIYSYSVNKDIRIIAQEPTGEDCYLLYVDHHDVAYLWIEKRKIDLGQGGQLLAVVTEQQSQDTSSESTPQVDQPGASYKGHDLSELLPAPAKGTPCLFDPYKDAELVNLGVPTSYLAMVRRIVTEDDLTFLLDKIPNTIADLLIDATRSSSTAEDGSTQLEVITPQPKEQERISYRSIFNDDELESWQKEVEAAMAGSFKDWRVYLHPIQRKAVETNSKGPSRITGGAGTGKTVCGLHRAQYLLSKGFSKVTLLTYNNDLTDNLKDLAVTLMGDAVGKQVEVCTYFHYIDGLLARQGKQLSNRKMEKAAFFRPAVESVAISGLAEQWTDELIDFLFDEIHEVIAPQQLKSSAAYIKAKRPRGARPLKLPQKKLVWQVYEASWQHACRTGHIPYKLTSHYALALGLEPSPEVALVVDEVQDLNAADLALIGAIAPGPNQLTLLEDAKQRIYGRGYSLKNLGINVVGRRSINLHINYRTTAEIGDAAAKSLESLALPLGDIPRALRSGQAPVTFQHKDRDEEFKWVAKTIDQVKTEGFTKIAVIAHHKATLEKIEPVLVARNIAFQSKRTDTKLGSGSGVYVTTIHSAKGLEFEIVFLIGFRSPRTPSWARNKPDSEQQDALRKEQHLLYVALSRARDRLYVSGPEAFPYA